MELSRVGSSLNHGHTASTADFHRTGIITVNSEMPCIIPVQKRWEAMQICWLHIQSCGMHGRGHNNVTLDGEKSGHEWGNEYAGSGK